MNISNYQIIEKSIENNSEENKFVSEVVLFATDDLKKFGVNPYNAHVFRSARHKNDMPSIFTFGKMDEAIGDAITKISESGSSLIKTNSDLIISDHLTIIGNSNNALVIDFLGGKKHLIRTEISVDKNGNFINLKIIAEINKVLKQNEIFKTEVVELYITDDVNEAIKNYAKKKIENLKVKTKKAPAIYCTWYYYGSTISYDDCLLNLKLIKDKKLPLDTFQIDDGWEDFIGDWNSNKKFPKNLNIVSEKIKEYGLIPGIWTSPFIIDKKSNFAKTYPNWILKNHQQKPCIFSINHHNYYILDITIPESWKYLEMLYNRLTERDGFTYHKLDFTRAPIVAKDANYQNKNITLIEAYRNACLSIRKGMGDSFFLMCGGLYDPLIGIVDAQRSGSDVLSMWSANNRGGKTLPFTMKQNILRYYMNYWWYNDPDAYVIRRNKKRYKGQKMSLGLLTDDEVKTSSINQLISGGLFSMTEPLDKIDEDRLKNIYHILPLKEADIELMDIMNAHRFPDVIKVNKDFLVIINYDDTKPLNKTITSKEILGGGIGEISITLKPHASTILKITGKKIFEVDNNSYYLK